MKRYNELAAKGVDEDYGKEAHRLAGLTKPPFYGAKNTGYSLCTMDGIKINTDMNALDTGGTRSRASTWSGTTRAGSLRTPTRTSSPAWPAAARSRSGA